MKLYLLCSKLSQIFLPKASNPRIQTCNYCFTTSCNSSTKLTGCSDCPLFKFCTVFAMFCCCWNDETRPTVTRSPNLQASAQHHAILQSYRSKNFLGSYWLLREKLASDWTRQACFQLLIQLDNLHWLPLRSTARHRELLKNIWINICKNS